MIIISILGKLADVAIIKYTKNTQRMTRYGSVYIPQLEDLWIHWRGKTIRQKHH